MANWLQDICKILRNSKTKQITGKLIEWDNESSARREPIGKCAMGELGCKAGMGSEELYKLPEYRYEEILKKYKVPLWLRQKNLPSINGRAIQSTLEFTINESYGRSLAEWIYELNDGQELSFKQIADFLEVTFGDLV